MLDFDATDDRVHGSQEGRGFHGYYRHYCYLPLYVFAGQHLPCAYLPPSLINPARHSRAVLKLLVTRLRGVWPDCEFVFQADVGFCRWKTLRWCEKHDVRYVVGLARNQRIQKIAEPWMLDAARCFEHTQVKQRVIKQWFYQARSWDRMRKIVVKAEHLPTPGWDADDDDKDLGAANLRCVVTDLPNDRFPPDGISDRWYCGRGDMENRIKEQQLGLFADRTGCPSLAANRFRVLLSAAAYVLMQRLRETALAGTDLASAQCTTIRVKLLKLAARVSVSARRVVLHLSSSWPRRALFAEVLAGLKKPTTMPAVLDSG